MITHITTEQLNALKKQLLIIREEILKEIEYGNNALKAGSKTTELEDYVCISESATIQSKKMNLLKQVNHALNKIDNGTYGYCEMTNEPIPYKRLQIIPYTPVSIMAQSKS